MEVPSDDKSQDVNCVKIFAKVIKFKKLAQDYFYHSAYLSGTVCTISGLSC